MNEVDSCLKCVCSNEYVIERLVRMERSIKWFEWCIERNKCEINIVNLIIYFDAWNFKYWLIWNVKTMINLWMSSRNTKLCHENTNLNCKKKGL